MATKFIPDSAFLEILACPWCVSQPGEPKEGNVKGELTPEGPQDHPLGLRCRQCGRLYKIENNIPNLLIEEAETPESVEKPAAAPPAEEKGDGKKTTGENLAEKPAS